MFNAKCIKAPSPENPSQEVTLRIDEDIVHRLSRIGRTYKIFEMYYNVGGELPPVNNVGYHEKRSNVVDYSQGIKDTYAVFQGLKRPHIEESGDESVFIYIYRPDFYYRFLPNMACTAARREFPPGAVFACYVNMDPDGKSGEIFNWEILKSQEGQPDMPDNFEQRYDTRRW